MNALAGGGTCVTLPAMIAAGVPSVSANVSSTVALWPDAIVGAWTYFDWLRRVCGVAPRTMLAITGAMAESG